MSFPQQYVNPELYQLKRFGGNNRRGGGGRSSYNHGTFKKGSFGAKPGGGYGGGRYENGGGFKKNFDSYGGGSSNGGASGSRFSDRKFEGGESSRNGQSFANGHTRFN